MVVTTRERTVLQSNPGNFLSSDYFKYLIDSLFSERKEGNMDGKRSFDPAGKDGGLLLALDFLSSDFYQTFHWQLVLWAQRWKHGWKKRASIYIYALYDDRLSQDGTTLLVLELPYNRWFAWWHHLTHSLFLLLMLIRAIVYWTPLSTSKTVLWEHFQCLYFQKTWAFWIVKL